MTKDPQMQLREAHQEITIMEATQRTTPKKAVSLWKYFHLGLQFGDPSQSYKKQVILIPP